MILSKSQSNKLRKKKSIEDAAFKLFTKNSFASTSIDQIVKEAKVAKGTFYLYFKDKDYVLRHLIYKKGSDLLREALQQSEMQKIDNHIERIIYLTEYMINYLQEHVQILKIISHNLTWGMYGKTLEEEKDEEINRILKIYVDDMMGDGYTEQEAFELLYMLIELVSSVTYSTIILNQPESIDKIKPMLFKSIRKMLQP